MKQKVPKDIFEIIKSEMERHRNNLRGIETQHKLSRKHINIFNNDGHCNSTFVAKLKIRKIVYNYQFQFSEPSKVKIHEIYCREMSTGYREQFDSLKSIIAKYQHQTDTCDINQETVYGKLLD